MRPSPFQAAALLWSLYWRDEQLATDFDILVRCGRVQQSAREAGHDHPAGWFARAAQTYVGDDLQGRIARAACEAVARDLARGKAH